MFGIPEYDLLEKIRHLKGSIEEKNEQIIGLKIFDNYKEIYFKYSSFDSIEALKRATFIQWYSATEPEVYTGISALDKDAEQKNLKRINELASKNLLDEEFKIMLSYYYSINDWYFDGFENIENLKSSLINKAQELSLKMIKIMVDRGQMGEYWNSLKK